MKILVRIVVLLTVAAAFVACSVEADGNGSWVLDIGITETQAPEFRWAGTVEPGKAIEIKGINGKVIAEPAAGNQIEVVALRHGRSDPNRVEIRVVPHEGGVTVCAVYPTPAGKEPNDCQPGEAGRQNVRNYHVNVDFTVKVPEGVRFVGRTVNGGIQAENLSAPVYARSVKGSIRFSTKSCGEAETVNGTIRASCGRADWTNSILFKSVNGSVELEMPTDLQAEVVIKTVNGRIDMGFPLTIQGEVNRRRLSGTIGSGGRILTANTVNGSVHVRPGA